MVAVKKIIWLLICWTLGATTARNVQHTYDHQNSVLQMNQHQKNGVFQTYNPSSETKFNSLIKQYKDALKHSKKDLGSWKLQFECDSCKVIVYIIQDLFAQRRSEDEIAAIITDVCVELKIEHERVCVGIVKEFKKEVLTVVDKLALSYQEVCGILLGDGCSKTYNPNFFWNITLPVTPKPPPRPPKKPEPQSPKLRILQLSDIHLDIDYKPGTNAECEEPLCCRENDGPIKGAPAGRWGDYRNCDAPTALFENLLQHLGQDEKFDLVYWTGDLPGHYVWNQTRAGGLALQDYIFKMFLKYLPGIPVYSALGNHEGVPINSFPPPFVEEDSVQWLYQALTSNWTHWLPNDTFKTISNGAYYTVLVKPGFRIISVNTNYCNNQNWWLLLNTTDPLSQLQWMTGVLQHAENQGEKVHIIGHIPPGHPACMKVWSWNYYKIVNRYENTIAAQFFGHTHFDDLEIFYDESDLTRPLSVAYIGPSVTPFVNLNPGYKIYVVDGAYKNSSLAVLDYETHILNLTDANINDKPVWKFEYKASTTYNTSSLFPLDVQALLERLASNNTLLQEFYRYKYKLHPPSPECDENCRRELLCDIQTGRSGDPSLCNHLMSEEEFIPFMSMKIVNSAC